MGPHHHKPEECEEDSIEYCAGDAEVLLRICQIESLVPNAEVECEEILPHEQSIHQHDSEDALRVPDTPSRIDA